MNTTTKQEPPPLLLELQHRIIAAVYQQGSSLDEAAVAGGLNLETFRWYMAVGRMSPSGKYREFYDAVTEADSVLVISTLGGILKASAKSKAAARWLSRRRINRRELGEAVTAVRKSLDAKKAKR